MIVSITNPKQIKGQLLWLSVTQNHYRHCNIQLKVESSHCSLQRTSISCNKSPNNTISDQSSLPDQSWIIFHGRTNQGLVWRKVQQTMCLRSFKRDRLSVDCFSHTFTVKTLAYSISHSFKIFSFYVERNPNTELKCAWPAFVLCNKSFHLSCYFSARCKIQSRSPASTILLTLCSRCLQLTFGLFCWSKTSAFFSPFQHTHMRNMHTVSDRDNPNSWCPLWATRWNPDVWKMRCFKTSSLAQLRVVGKDMKHDQ